MEANGKNQVKYPVGEQSFEELRLRQRLYVDKTRYIELLVDSGSKYFFLGRPRRFGKSLFLSTLKCFYEGKRHLFEGLYADSMDWDWKKWPVLYFDLNYATYTEHSDLQEVLDNQLSRYEEQYGIKEKSTLFSLRFDNLIRKAKAVTKLNVVILIDEYDKPLVYNLHDKAAFERMRLTLMDFYSCFKSDSDFIEMAFLTGVTRFSHLSLFSGNNIDDISFDLDFSAICGITHQELLDNFQPGIEALAERYRWSTDKVIEELKRRYDGYHFSEESPDIYNPFSLLSAMSKKRLGNYWLLTGGLTRLVLQLIKKLDLNFESLINATCTIEELQGLNFDAINPEALLYQTGYLTIKDFNLRRNRYKLGIPNNEVKSGLLSFLLPYYASGQTRGDLRFNVDDFIDELNEGRVDDFMQRLKSLLAAVPYDVELQRESNLQVALLILMMLVGMDARAEERTSDGRIDLFIRTDLYYYIIELKIDSTAQEALDQINRKDYALPFATDSRHLIKIGANFSTTHRRLTDWLAEADRK